MLLLKSFIQEQFNPLLYRYILITSQALMRITFNYSGIV